MKKALLLTTGLLFGITAHAGSYEQAKQAMMDELTNPQKAFDFVQEAIKAGDLSGAASALERILRLNPTLSNIELELGVLYLRMGNPDIAARHIKESLKSPEVPVWVRGRAKNLLSRAEKSANPHRFSFSVRSAARYDDNANAAPDDPLVRAAGQDVLLDLNDTGRSDSSWEVSPALLYTYAFNSESGNQLEVSLNSYHRRYDESSELDVDSLNFRIGPRLNFGPVFNPSISIQPYALASRLNLDSEKYLESYGGGINLRKIFSPVLNGQINLEYAQQDYFNSPTRRNAEERSGGQWSLNAGFSYLLSPKQVVSFSLIGSQRDADVTWEERDMLGASLAFSQGFNPLAKGRPWNFRVSLSAETMEYDAANPTIDPNQAREEDRVSVGLNLSIPVSRNAAVFLSSNYTEVDASLPNYEYDNWGGSLGFRLSF